MSRWRRWRHRVGVDRHAPARRAGRARAAAPVVHTVVVGGTPGWQIALIAIGAALVAAIAAVLMERARSARRPVTAAA